MFFAKLSRNFAARKKAQQDEREEEGSDAKFFGKAKLKGKMLITVRVVGERRIRGEVVAKAAVDCIRVRMPE